MYLKADLLHLVSPDDVGKVVSLQEFLQSFRGEEVGRSSARVERETLVVL